MQDARILELLPQIPALAFQIVGIMPAEQPTAGEGAFLPGTETKNNSLHMKMKGTFSYITLAHKSINIDYYQ